MRSRLAICVLTFLLIAPPLLAQQPGLVTTTARRLASDVDLTVGLTTGGKNVYVYATEGSELAPALTAGNWTVGAGWESPIVGPGLIKNADGTGTQTPSAATTIVAGTTYKVVITLSAWSVGSAYYTLGGMYGSTLAAATTYTDYITASTTGKLIITPTNTSRFTISAISYKALTDATGDTAIYGSLKLASPIQNAAGDNIIAPLPGGNMLFNNTMYFNNGTADFINASTRTVATNNVYLNALQPQLSTATINLHTTSTSTANLFLFTAGSGTHSQTSGTNGILKISPTYNQASGTAANTDLLINRTETAVGSGTQRLFDAQVGSTSKFNVSNTGVTGIGTSAPDKQVEINSTTGANLRLTYNDADGGAANYTDFATTAGGNLTVTPSGGTASIVGDITRTGANAQTLTISQATVSCNVGTSSGCTGAGTDTITVTNLIPAGAIVMGVSARVITILAGASLTTWKLGVSGALTNWGATLAIAADTIADSVSGTYLATWAPTYYGTATSLVMTANAGVISTGVVRFTVHYIKLTAPTS